MAVLRSIDDDSRIGHHLKRWAGEATASGTLPPDHLLRALPPDAVTARNVIDLARAGDLPARALVERAGATLAGIAGVFGSLYDPQRIIVSGGLAAGC